MARAGRKQQSRVAGLPPGTLVHVGEQRVDHAIIDVIDYDETSFQERTVPTLEDCLPFIRKSTVTWINITGLHDTTIFEKLGGIFSIHPLVLEDILNTGQRPKCEDHEKYMFLVLKMLYSPPDSNDIVTEQLSLILCENCVLSFQETRGDVFDLIRDRIRTAKGRIRKMKADYLAYSLLDAIVDNYFIVLERVGESIENLQPDVLDKPATATLQSIQSLRREMVAMRKAVWPLREVTASLEKSESPLFDDATTPYLRDVYEHTIQIMDSIESMRDTLNGTLDIYMTTISNRMNEVMKVLTVIATIFIPLTFVAGVYGMNFEHMPELKWRYGYAGAWAIMLVAGMGMAWLFKKRRWW